MRESDAIRGAKPTIRPSKFQLCEWLHAVGSSTRESGLKEEAKLSRETSYGAC